MSMIETVTLWNEGVGQWDEGQAQTALSTFSRINQPSSKILFNMGCCHFSIQQYQQAIQVGYILLWFVSEVGQLIP